MRTPSAASITSSGSLGRAMEAVKVVVRCRPLNAKEVEQGHETCVQESYLNIDLVRGSEVQSKCGHKTSQNKYSVMI